jgi:hypothetical protein
MIRLAELIRIPVPYPAKPKPPVSTEILQAFRWRISQLVGMCVRNGVMNPHDAREFVKNANAVFGTVEDLEYRMTLREVFDAGDTFDLRTRWKEEYRRVIKFRDTIRDTLNALVQRGLVAVPVADNVKREVDDFYEQIIEIDRTIQSVLRRL